MGGITIKTSSIKQNRLSRCDIFALILGVIIAVYYFYSVRIGIQAIDETYYFTITHRMALGDRLILDEWHITQLAALFQYLPYRLFYSIVGSNEGVCLTFRYVYVVIKIAFYYYIYFSLRKHKWWGILAAFIFTSFNSFTFTTINYYNLIDFAVCLTGIILFIKEKPSRFDYVFAGIVFACGVVCTAGPAIAYFVYCALIIIYVIRKRKNKPFLDSYGFIINTKAWFWISIGIAASAVVVLCVLFIGTDIKDVLAALEQIPKDTEYNYATGTAKVFKLYKLLRFISPAGFDFLQYHTFKTRTALFFTFFFNMLAALSLIVGYSVMMIIIFKNSFTIQGQFNRGVTYSYQTKLRLRIFLAAFIIYIISQFIMLISGSFTPIYNGAMSAFRPVYLCFLSTIAYFLTKNKNKTFFAFLLFVFLSSFGMDFTSEMSTGNVTIAACIPGVLIIRDLLTEIFEEEKIDLNTLLRSFSLNKKIRPQYHKKDKAKIKKLSVLCICVVLLILSEVYYSTFALTWHTEDYHDYHAEHPVEASTYVKIETGPLKGLSTNLYIKERYDEAVDDLDVIRGMPDKPLYVADICSWYYLYAEKPYSVYSTYYVEADSRTRTLDWWDMHPDKTPGIIYIPFFDWDHGTFKIDKQKADDKVEWFNTLFDFELTEGKAGYILLIK